MPILQNAQHEAFARARAKGARLEDAYEDAGFVHGHGNAGRLLEKPEVPARIGELRAEQDELADANIQGVIVSLLRIAKASEALATPAGVKGARLTLIEACRLSADMAHLRCNERPFRRIG